ncbi:MAG: hypothetical protein ACK5WQ_03400 [Alphaproteobacteria bacterium]
MAPALIHCHAVPFQVSAWPLAAQFGGAVQVWAAAGWGMWAVARASSISAITLRQDSWAALPAGFNDARPSRHAPSRAKGVN